MSTSAPTGHDPEADDTAASRAAGLGLDDQARLTAGVDFWSTHAVASAGVPAITMTDGPNGARGAGLLGAGRTTAVCVPSGTALAATWDVDLIERVGHLLGQEARTKGARILLAPTINLHRWPLAGRNFECMSEDPYLTGRMAAAYVRGVQAEGVAATLKHLVGNEAEFQRTTVSSQIEERALRELYLLPFEIGIRQGDAWAVMTAYNRVNGVYCSEDPELLNGILRGEWGFDGVVMTDWLAAGSTVGSALAGLDLQMPGPDRFFGAPLAEAVKARRVPPGVVEAIAARWLRLIDRVGAWHDGPAVERAIDLPEHRELAERAAADAMVLLRNDGVLPLRDTDVRRVAVIGPNAATANIMGGGSAQLRPHFRQAPIEPLTERLGDRIVFERGCDIDRTVRPLARPLITTPDGGPGVLVEHFAALDWQGDPVATLVEDSCRLLWFGSPVDGVDENAFSFRARTRLRVTETGTHTFTLVQAGRARVRLDGEVILDGISDPPPPGEEFFSLGSQELRADIELKAGEEPELVIEYSAEGSALLHGAKIGYRPPLPGDLLDRAVAAAADADAAIVVVGTSDEWETEGSDREDWRLPGEQNELVRRVCAANPRTVVVVNAGSPVPMDWADDAAAVLVCWLGGQGMAAALDQVLFGEAEPAGRLPTTFPMRLEHSPAYGTVPGANNRIEYREGVFVGYRWFTSRQLPVRFPFGHGLSYTTFEWGTPRVSADVINPGGPLEVEVGVTNSGDRRGAEVVQCYVSPASARLPRPIRELRGFAKLWLDPGETAVARIELDARAFAYWDPGSTETAALREQLGDVASLIPQGHGADPRNEAGWYVDAADYEIQLARSADDIVATVTVRAPDELALGRGALPRA